MFSVLGCSPLSSALLTGAVTLLLVKIWQTYRRLSLFKRMGIPGPAPLPFLGNTRALAKEGQKGFFARLDKQFGKMYGVFLPHPVLVVTDVELIREILIKKFPSFANRTDIFLMEKDQVTKDSMLCLTGDHWKHVRGQLSPAFSSNKLKQMVPAIERVAQTLKKCLTDKAAKAEEIELKALCQKVTMDVVAGVAFGVEVNSVLDVSDAFSGHVTGMVTTFSKRLPFFIMFPFVGQILAMAGITPFAKSHTHFLVSVINEALRQRQLDSQTYSDFLQLLVEAQKAEASQGEVDAEINFTQELKTSSGWTRKGLTLSEMHANVITFLVAGKETVATAMAMTLFSLAAHPECLHKAQREVDNKIGKNPITYDAAMSLNYIDMCLNEAMRLHFPVLLERQVSEDVDLAGHHLTKGLSIIIPNNVLHLDPNAWTDPEKFDPERFAPEARAARPPLTFVPFGMGPRNCIGMRLAQLETRMIIASFLQSFTPVLCKKSVYPPELKPLTTDTVTGMWIKLESRKDAC